MGKFWLALIVVALGFFAVAAPAQAAEPLWQRDGALIGKVIDATQSGGIGAVAPHAAALKTALAGAKVLFPGPTTDGDKSYVLTDGPGETTAVLAGLAAGKGDVTALPNPYPVAALILGSFYNETGKFSDALKALDAGLALSPLPKQRLGSYVPDLLSERGVTLGRLKRWKDALASYDSGLALGSLDKHMHAVLYRGRGFVLVELGRLDEGEAAYKSSLKFEPGNPIAANELAYIANLRAGAKPLAPNMTMLGAKQK